MSPTTAFNRAEALNRLPDAQFDLLVIGGGITGAGVALDAAARGLSTALVDKGDFASGTSSKSSKLIHGGLRYLQQREVALVYENLAERQRLLRNAPHLVEPLPFLIPLFGRNGVVSSAVAKAYSTALWLYDFTGGLRIGKLHSRIDRQEVLGHMPALKVDNLVSGFIYYDARADDARLTLAIARTAVLDHGAVACNYAPVANLTKQHGRVVGAELALGEGASAQPVLVRARAVVNATGVWADLVRAMDEGEDPHSIRPAKGIHITVPQDKCPCDIAAVLPVSADRRSIFVIPWGEDVYIGTTDTDYQGPLDDPQCSPADVAYLLEAVNSFIQSPISPDDVTGSWAGLRPLLATGRHGGVPSSRTADLSRRHQVSVSASGLVTVTGGKLTTYRKMAADTVDEVVQLVGQGKRRSPTKSLRIRGAQSSGSGPRSRTPTSRPTSPGPQAHLTSRYGSEASQVMALAEASPALSQPLVEGLPYLAAEAVWAVRSEMAVTLEDVLARRTRALLHRRQATVEAAPKVAELIAQDLGWSTTEIDRQVKALGPSQPVEAQS